MPLHGEKIKKSRFVKWKQEPIPEKLTPIIVQEKISHVNIHDADTEVIFETEKLPLTIKE